MKKKLFIGFTSLALSTTLFISTAYAASQTELQNALREATDPNTYTIMQDETFTNVKTMIKDSNFTLDGNNYNIDGENNAGYTVQYKKTVAIKNVGDMNDENSKGFFNFNGSTGGVFYNYGGDLTVSDSKFFNNNAKREGGAVCNFVGTLTASDSKFLNNNTETNGGAIYSRGMEATLSNLTFLNNTAENSGGAIYSNYETLTISDSIFSNNTAKNDGGAIQSDFDTLNISDSIFSSNAAKNDGGALRTHQGNITISDSTFSNNIAEHDGGAIDAFSNSFIISESTFSNNTAKNNGGAINNDERNLILSNITFLNNTAENDGGAVFLNGNNIIVDSVFYNNKAQNGGGVYIANNNDAFIQTKKADSIFTGNTANGKSNAIYNNKKLFLNTSPYTKIIFNDGIDGNDVQYATIAVNKDSYGGTITGLGSIDFPSKGTVVFNNTVENNHIELYDGKVKLDYFTGETIDGKVIAPSEGNFSDTVTFKLSGGVLDTFNDKIKNDYRLKDLHITNGKLAIDVKFDGNNNAQSDIFTIDTGNGAISFDNINVFGNILLNSTGETQVIDGAAKKDLSFKDFAAITSDNIVKFKESANKGFVNYSISKNTNGLKTALDWDSSDRSYKMTRDEIVSSDLGEIQGSTSPFHIYGRGHSILGNNKEGIIVKENQIITLEDISSIKGFKDDTAIINKGEVEISNVTFNNKIIGSNTANLNFINNNKINSIIENNNINLYGGVLNLGALADISGANSFNVNLPSTLSLQNGAIQNANLGNLTLNSNLNLMLDANLAKAKIDTISTKTFQPNNYNINISNIKIIEPTAEESLNLSILGPMTDESLKSVITYNGGDVIYSPIFKYNVEYDADNASLDFTRFGAIPDNPGAKPSYNSLNPGILASAVAAQLGGYLTQLNSYDEAFRNMDMYMLMTQKQRQALKLRNKYAAADGGLVFDPTASKYQNNDGWFRPYATFESVPLKNGPKVSNVAYGTFFGGESKLYELPKGWDAMWGLYAGYNGSHQAFDGVGIYQNGGTLGALAMLYKDNFFTGLTANVGASVANANSMFGGDDFTMLMSGVAAKTGYNFEFADGKYIIQPNLLMSYSFVNTFDYTNDAGIHINSDPLHAIQIEPGVKFIANLKNGWQPYLGVNMVWNIIDKTHFSANDVMLPELAIKPFVKYGIGVRKVWGDRFSGFFQTYITNGGRNGVGLQAGFSWMLGREPQTAMKKLNTKTPELKKAQIDLRNI